MVRATHLPSPTMEPKQLWRPSADRAEHATIARFAREVGHEGDYDELWRWSVDDLEGFWAAIWEFFDVQASEPYERVLGSRKMPGAQWFPGSRLSYPEHFFRERDDDAVAIRHVSELRELSQWTWAELREQTARIAAGLRRMDVRPGDRVAAYMPNIP
jgi:acetoacetyl-CoA synthetase